MTNDTSCYLLASESVAKLLKEDAEDALMVCPWLEDGTCYIVPEEAWDKMIAQSERWEAEHDCQESVHD